MPSEVEFDEWRENLYDPVDGRLTHEDVLFIRARLGEVEYHCPVWHEDEIEIADTKMILERKVRMHPLA